MGLAEIAAPLVLVIDPFGNLPFVVSVLARLSLRRYLWAVTREIVLAFIVLGLFGWLGQRLLLWFGIEQAALHIAGGVVLFLIALKMVFASAAELFSEDERIGEDPIAVPIAMPAIAGPSAIATVLFFASRQDVSPALLQQAIALSLVLTWLILAGGRALASFLSPRMLAALEKLTGMLLSILAVDMVLDGVKSAFFD